MSGPTVPPTLSPGEIARACGVTRDKALTELKSAGLIEWRGGRMRISESKLRERLPDHYDRVYRFFVLEEQGRRKSPRVSKGSR
jgi:flagellar capping protein FliD